MKIWYNVIKFDNKVVKNNMKGDIKMAKFYNTSLDEQETIINVDYGKREVHCYTSRYAVYDRLLAKLGEPTKTFYTNKKISGASWIIPFSEKKVLATIFSRPTIVGSL